MTTRQLLFDAMIDAHGKRNPMRRVDILKKIPYGMTSHQLGGILSRMVKEGLISKISRGIYQLNVDADRPIGTQAADLLDEILAPKPEFAQKPRPLPPPDFCLAQHLYGPVPSYLWD